MNENLNIDEHQNYPDSEQSINVPTMKVLPLKKICMTIGELPTSYLETMTYYEMLVWFIEYLKNNIIPTINNNANAVQEVQNVVIELQTYINNFKDSIDEDVEELEEYMNNYFENLDVQEEINNKLDDMLENGTLQEIIDAFLQSTAIWCFDTVADMKLATNLINGSFARTLGYYSINDGGGALYKITDTASVTEHQEEVGTLYATLINNKNNPLCYGAKQNDSTYDNSLIVSEMLNLGITNISFPKGRYYFLTTITPVSYLTINGNQSRFDYIGTGSFIERTENTDIINVKIKDCNIYGLSTNNCFDFKRLVDSTIENTRIDGFNIGLKTNYCWDNLVQRCRFQNTIKPLVLESQTNNILFSNCAFATFSSRMDFTNNEGIEFNACEFNNSTYSTCILAYACSLTFINCYYENIAGTFVSASGTSQNHINIYGGKCSDSDLKIYPGIGYIDFNEVKHGRVKILPVNIPTNNPAMSDSMKTLNVPNGYMDNKYKCHTFFNGTSDITLNTYGTGTTKSFTNGELIISNTNEGSKGFVIENLEVGKDYLLMVNVDTLQEDAKFSFQFVTNTLPDYSGFYSVSKSITDKYLLCPFKATGQTLRVTWSHTNDIKISKLIVVEI